MIVRVTLLLDLSSDLAAIMGAVEQSRKSKVMAAVSALVVAAKHGLGLLKQCGGNQRCIFALMGLVIPHKQTAIDRIFQGAL